MEEAMSAEAFSNINLIEWEVAEKTHPGEVVCGDSYLVAATRAGILLCVVDGLGHGDEAAHASKTVVTHLRSAQEDSVKVLLTRCNEVLKPTRGAVLSMALIDVARHTMEWAGVGNVEALVVHQDESREWMPARGGIVGSRFPSVHPTEVKIGAGDLILMCTDGIKSDFAGSLLLPDQAPGLADRILRTYANGRDDAVVLVARYRGGA